MKIGIDISQIIYKGTGVGRYTENLVRELLKIDKNNDYILFGSSLRKKEILEEFVNSCKTRGSLWSFPPTFLDILWNKTHIINIDKFMGSVDVFHSSDWVQPPSEAKKVTTVHDLVVYKYPEFLPPKIVAVQKKRLEWVKKECDLIIAVSENTKKDIVETLKIDSGRVRVIYEAAAMKFKNEKEAKLVPPKAGLKIKNINTVKEKYDIKDEYILTVGTREPRKNLKRLIDAFGKLDLKDTELVIAGKFGWGEDIKGKNNIKILDYVNQKDLPFLYGGARFFVYPSFYEGFGLPVLEAMSLGCPVIISNMSSLPEIGGEAAIYVDPADVDDIAEKMKHLYFLGSNDYNSLVKKVEKQAEKFSWQKMAQETLLVYKELLR